MLRIFRMKLIARSRFRADSTAFRPIQPPPARPNGGRSDHVPQVRRFDFRTGRWRNARYGEFAGVRMFTGVKVFSATKAKERDDLGEQVTRWLRANADLQIVDRTVMQSSDNEFHCLTVVIFYKPRNGAKKG
jgi:hypothetical protein